MPDKTEETCALRRFMGGRGLVLASLAANIFFVGMLSATLLQRPTFPAPPPFMPGNPGGPPGRMPFDRIAGDLSREDAEHLRKIYEETNAGMGAHHDDLLATSAKIADILRQEKPDLVALQAEMDRMEAVGKDFHAKMSESLRRVATEFSLETRQKIADHLAHGRFAFDLRRGGHGGERGGPRGEMMPPPSGPDGAKQEP